MGDHGKPFDLSSILVHIGGCISPFPSKYIPAEVTNELHDCLDPGVWSHPGVLTKVLHHMEVRTSLLTQACVKQH